LRKKVKIALCVKEGGEVPQYSSQLASGADLMAAIEETILLSPGQSILVPTKIHVEVPEGYEIQIRPRSGLALRHGITVLNTPGTIDADFRGEIGVILINHGKETFAIQPKMKIAQMVLAPVVWAQFVEKNTLTKTERGEGGFGHTGLFGRKKDAP
jgi:dUTP pyrophosphatase